MWLLHFTEKGRRYQIDSPCTLLSYFLLEAHYFLNMWSNLFKNLRFGVSSSPAVYSGSHSILTHCRPALAGFIPLDALWSPRSQTNHYSQTSKQDLFAKQMLLFFTLLRNCPTRSPVMSYGFTSLKAPEADECVSNCSETRSESIHAIRSQRRTVTGWVPQLDAKRGKKRVAGIIMPEWP